MPKVRFEPYGVEVDVPEGTSLMAAADEAAQQVEGEFFYGECCEGRLQCGNCCLELVRGAENLSPVTEQEAAMLKVVAKSPAWRASCSAMLLGDVVARVLPRPGTSA